MRDVFEWKESWKEMIIDTEGRGHNIDINGKKKRNKIRRKNKNL